MRKFYVLIYDSQLKNATVVNKHEKGNLDTFLLNKAIAFDKITIGLIKNDLKLYLKLKKVNPDLIANSYSIQILSNKALDLMMPFIKDDVQVIDLDLINEETKQIIKGYSLLHPTKSFRCLDFEKTEFVRKDEPIVLGNDITIKAKNIPDNIHIFRLEENTEYIIISQELLDAITDKGLKGLCVIICDSV